MHCQNLRLRWRSLRTTRLRRESAAGLSAGTDSQRQVSANNCLAWLIIHLSFFAICDGNPRHAPVRVWRRCETLEAFTAVDDRKTLLKNEGTELGLFAAHIDTGRALRSVITAAIKSPAILVGAFIVNKYACGECGDWKIDSPHETSFLGKFLLRNRTIYTSKFEAQEADSEGRVFYMGGATVSSPPATLSMRMLNHWISEC